MGRPKQARRHPHSRAKGSGLILSAAEAMCRDAPWSNVLTMLDEWRRRDCPLVVG